MFQQFSNKQIFHSNLILKVSTIFVLDNAKTGYKGQHQRFCGLGLLEKSGQFIVEILIV